MRNTDSSVLTCGPVDCGDRRSVKWLFRLLLLPAVASVAAGCGSGENLPATAPVTGVVTFEGKPVETATVMFYPVDAAATNPAGAYTDKEGKFSLTTYEKDDGALLGTHEVTVQLFDGVGEVKQIPGRYGNRETSGFKLTVKEGENNFPLELTAKPKK